MRKMISFKIENLPDKERKIVDDWANGQANIQQSLANIVMHVVKFTGNADVMDFDVQRKLHTIFANNELVVAQDSQQTAIQKPIEAQPKNEASIAESDVISKAMDLFEED